MIIGYDGKRAVNNMTGLGNYSRLVIETLAVANPTSSFLVYTPGMRDNPRLSGIRDMHNVEFRLPPPQGFHGSLWRSWGISNNLKADKVDIFHGLSNELPLNIKSSGVPSVVTMHDVIYRRLPYCYTPIDRRIYDFKYGRACRNATRIIAVSRRTKDDVVEFYGIDPDKIDVIYQGCDDSFRKEIPVDSLYDRKKRHSLPDRYILQVGTIERRKNLELTVRALSALPSDISLVAVGRDHHGYLKEVKDLAAKLGVAHRIVWLQDLPFSDLPAINRMAEVIVYPSRYEGFGIPVLEALESMRPIIAATGSCLEEAGGDAAFYVNPDDPKGLASVIYDIISSSDKLKPRIEAGKVHAGKFNNSAMSEAINYAYQKTIQEFRNGQKQGCR